MAMFMLKQVFFASLYPLLLLFNFEIPPAFWQYQYEKDEYYFVLI